MCGETGHRANECPTSVRAVEQEEAVTRVKRIEVAEAWGICSIEVGSQSFPLHFLESEDEETDNGPDQIFLHPSSATPVAKKRM